MKDDDDSKEKLVSVERLSKDLAAAATTLSDAEARFLVDGYYMMQENRIRAGHQVRALGENAEPHSLLHWLSDQSETLENQIKRALDKYTDAQPLGRWARDIVGIGPVIAAGLLSHIDIAATTSAGKVWRFAGLDNTSVWVSTAAAEKWIDGEIEKRVAQRATEPIIPKVDMEMIATAGQHFGRRFETLLKFATTDRKGEPVTLTKNTLAKAISRRPHNARLKTLCWKIGESFVKVSGNERDFYGKFYLQRKALEAAKNERGEYAELAAAMVANRPGHAQVATYKQGKLPLGHLHSRAKRYAVKLFLAHYWETGRTLKGLPVPLPYPIQYLGHTDVIAPPNPVKKKKKDTD